MKRPNKKRLGEVLQERGKISSDDLKTVIAEQPAKAIYLGEILFERGLVAKPDIVMALEEVSQFQYVDCTSVSVEPSALALIPRGAAERFPALPIRHEGGQLVVAMSSPQDLAKVEELRFMTGCAISPRLAFRSELYFAIRKYYADQSSPSPEAASTKESEWEDVEFISTSARQSTKEAVQELQADLRQRKTPAVQIVSEVIQMALKKRASDIHIEPRLAETAVRIRVDGVLRDLRTIPRTMQNSVSSRVKILADMDIAERRAPQDGRFMVNIGLRQIDVRVSTLPTQYGEKVVIRLLSSSQKMTFEDVGMTSELAATFTEMLSTPQGMILVTGPTGAGKSTTLYAALTALRKPSVNIVTVEDPVEYILPGINQAHVNAKAGLTFASCLRSILRQDPNVIMVGEIRDVETAEIAMKAAQTGHMVLSTLHTNDSISAVARLLDLGVPSFLLGSSLTGILAQRLLRKLCSCHTVQKATADFRARLAAIGTKEIPATMCVPAGCEQCDFTGYKGRVGVFELLRFDEFVREIVRTGGGSDEIRFIASSHGLRTMQEDALVKLAAGLTTLDEILRVLAFDKVAGATCLRCNQKISSSFRFCPSCGTRLGEANSKKRAGTEVFAGYPS